MNDTVLIQCSSTFTLLNCQVAYYYQGMPSSFLALQHEQELPDQRPPSPTAPPYSPIMASVSNPDAVDHHTESAKTERLQVVQPPPPMPIADSDNPDAIALRAALGILQIQRQHSLEDIKRLEQQKTAALSDPKKFVAALANSDVVSASRTGLSRRYLQSEADIKPCRSSEDDETSSDIPINSQSSEPIHTEIPVLQEVARCPPINWAKYHVDGGILDTMHEEQRKRPSSGSAVSDWPEGRTTEHRVTAPFNPWNDHSEEPPSHARHGTHRPD